MPAKLAPPPVSGQAMMAWLLMVQRLFGDKVILLQRAWRTYKLRERPRRMAAAARIQAMWLDYDRRFRAQQGWYRLTWATFHSATL